MALCDRHVLVLVTGTTAPIAGKAAVSAKLPVCLVVLISVPQHGKDARADRRAGMPKRAENTANPFTLLNKTRYWIKKKTAYTSKTSWLLAISSTWLA